MITAEEIKIVPLTFQIQTFNIAHQNTRVVGAEYMHHHSYVVGRNVKQDVAGLKLY